MGSGAVTPVTAPVTRAGSENEDEDEDEDGDDDDENGDDKKMMPIRRRSEGVTVDVCNHIPTFPKSNPLLFAMHTQANHITHTS